MGLKLYTPSLGSLTINPADTASSITITIPASAGTLPILSSSTTNGIPYLTGSNILTSGSALTFDGSGILTVGSDSVATVFNAPGDVVQYVVDSNGTGSSASHQWRYGSSEAMRLTSTGLGIGTSSPAAKLDVNGTANFASTVTLSGGTANGVLYLNGSKVATSGSALTWNGTGLGVGVASAAFALDVGGADGTNIALRSTGTSSARFRAYVNGAESGVIGFLNGGGQFFEVAGSEQMRLTSTGLGIGTSSPGTVGVSGYTRLVLGSGSSSTDGMTIVPSGTGGIQFTDAANTKKGFVQWDSSTGALALGTAATTRVTVDSSGNLGLGVTPSGWYSGYTAFEFGGYGSLTSRAATNDTELSTNAYRNTSATYIYKKNGSAQSFDMANGVFTWNTAPSGTAGSAISFTQAMTLDASGNLLVGDTSYRLSGITAAGQAIQFGSRTFIGTSPVGDTALGGLSGSNYTALYANGSERMRLDSSGNLLVARTTPGLNNGTGFTFLTSGSLQLESASSSYINRTTSDGATIAFRRQNADVGSIFVTGSATSYNTSSDYRLKNITSELTGYKERILALQPKQGTWKADGSEFRGFLAHEFAEQYPAAVSGEKDAVDENGNPKYQGMQAGGSETIADLVALVKELVTEIETLKTQLGK